MIYFINCLAEEKNYIIYWKYGNLSMIGMLLNNICEIWNHNIIKQEYYIFFLKIYHMGRMHKL